MQAIYKSKHIPGAAQQPNTYYHESAERPTITENIIGENSKFDVAIIGAGLTGVSAALRLAKSGAKVAVFESHQIGSGASGRNGGLVCTGYRHDQKWLAQKMGAVAARELWELSEAAKVHLANMCRKYKINADYESGMINAAHNPRMAAALESDAEFMSINYDYKNYTVLNREQTNAALGTNCYFGGLRDDGAGRIHPLKLLYGLSKAAQDYGAFFFENCMVNSVQESAQSVILNTAKGLVKADKIIICGDGYLEGVNSETEATVLPIYSFVIATEPLNDQSIMKNAVCAADTRFVLNYFQITNDRRLIFGGGEKYSASWPKDIGGFVAKNMSAIFPQLSDIKISHAWGGALGITNTRLPMVRQISPRVLVGAGYSGQGVLLAPFFGNILGEMVLGYAGRFDKINKMPVSAFPGGRFLRFPLLSAAMSYFSILDKLP